ncbi:nuclear factor erythroid 2-related factor 2b [Electrophorus electricus]|uniref:nuclear factor erythroid 2-related factor 2b n=1 Tax=Electrophorus electricus TaxID=8005 RepID=UPI0015CFA0C3|nr:nuclear factor erythroid 2-related factor 2b [Electrophorus electricus]
MGARREQEYCHQQAARCTDTMREGASAGPNREQETSLIDTSWQQDIGLGVEWEEPRVPFCEWAGEMQRARKQEQGRIRREGEGQGVLLTFGNLDQETGEILPDCLLQTSQTPSPTLVSPEHSPSTPCSQGSPLTQNPLLAALLFTNKPTTLKVKSSTQPLPDLQYYLDLLEVHVPERPCAPLVDTRENNNYLLPEPLGESSETGLVSGTEPLTPPHSDSTEITQVHRDTLADLIELARPLTQSLPDTAKFKQTFCGSEELSHSFLDANIHSSPLDNPNQMNSTACEETLSTHTQRDVCQDHTSTVTLAHTLYQDEFTQKDSSHTFSSLADSTTLFHIESAIEPVALDMSLYGVDPPASQSEAEEAGHIHSDHTELFDLCLLSDSEEVESSPFQSWRTEAVPTQLTQNTLHEEAFHLSSRAQTASPPTRGARRNRSTCHDEQHARALCLPLSVDDIVGLSADAFNEAVGDNELSQAQLVLLRDIRRRGKNKMAAQSCRKRKLDKMVDLEAEVEALREKSERGMRERESNVRALRETKQKLRKLYYKVFSQLRDKTGKLYSPREYTLQHSSNGHVYLLPRTAHMTRQAATRP